MKTRRFYFEVITLYFINAVVFYPTLKSGFYFDDRPAILKNRDVIGPGGLGEIFVHDFWGQNITDDVSHKSFRPLTTLTFKFDAWISGFSPFYFHLVNINVHSFNSILIYIYLTRVIKEKSGFLVSLLFSVHPVHVEAVAASVGRADLLCATFVISGILFHFQTRWRFKWILTSGFSLISTLFKEQGMILMPLIFVHEIGLDPGLRSLKFNFKRIFRKLVSCLIPTLSILTLRLWINGFKPPKFQEGDNPSAFVQDKIMKWINFHYIYALNFLILFVPDWLCFDWSMGCVPVIRSYRDIRMLSGLGVWIVVFLVISRRSKVGWMSIGWIVVSFLPSSNLLATVGFVVAERNLYLSSIGFAMMSGCAMRSMNIQKWVLLLLIFNLGGWSFIRSGDWTSEERLYVSGLRVCPDNAKIYYNIAKLKADSRSGYIAEKLYRKAIDLWPRYEHALNNLGNLLKGSPEGKEEAEQLFVRALEISPKFAAAWMNLGVVQVQMKKYDLAFKSYQRAIELRKGYSDAHYNLGSLYLKMNLKTEALEEFSKALKHNDKHFAAATNQIILLDELERYEEAEKLALEGAEKFKERADFYFHLGNIYGKTSQFEKAEEQFLKAIKKQDNVALYHTNLGVLYHRWKRYKEAAQSYEKVLKIDPNNAKVRSYLNSLKKMGKG